MAPDRWLVVLLRIHFPLHPVAQLHEVRSGVIDMLADPDLIAEFELNPDARALLEGMIASVEEGVKL